MGEGVSCASHLVGCLGVREQDQIMSVKIMSVLIMSVLISGACRCSWGVGHARLHAQWRLLITHADNRFKSLIGTEQIVSMLGF